MVPNTLNDIIFLFDLGFILVFEIQCPMDDAPSDDLRLLVWYICLLQIVRIIFKLHIINWHKRIFLSRNSRNFNILPQTPVQYLDSSSEKNSSSPIEKQAVNEFDRMPMRRYSHETTTIGEII